MKLPRKPLSDDFESDPLWNLLGQAEEARQTANPVQVSPFFARNVVREIRLAQEQSQHRPLAWFWRSWRLLCSSALAAGVIVLLFGSAVMTDSQLDFSGNRFALQDSADLEVIQNLDELLNLESSLWLDSTASVY